MTDIGPKDLIFTLFGDYIRHRGGEVWTGSLIHLLQILGVSSPQAVRAALSRMTQRGWLQSRKVGRRSYYSLTAKGHRLLESGARRIFLGRQGPWDGRWRILTYRIPDDQTRLRTRLRRELGWIGFGRLDASLYIAPYDYADELADLFERLPVRQYVDIFVGRYEGSDLDLVARAWDLASINEKYRRFVEKYRPLYEADREAFTAGNGPDPQTCFVRRFMLTHEYREFPFLDPDLPQELLPSDWVGHEARDVFHEYHELLTGPAIEYFDSVFQGAPDRPSADAEAEAKPET
ncbi:MAG: PaaX family transcriptional regulator C-terminal domain-containing protein [Ardenticatenia bacterium]|nr:PaaX family transcriptional regulator C-terminal domain-containing protein [Ardenticatenia bacterium]